VACEVGKRGAAVAGEGTDEAVESARRDVVKLSGANGGQSDDGSDGEGLHFDGSSGVDTVIGVVRVLWYVYTPLAILVTKTLPSLVLILFPSPLYDTLPL